MTDARYETAERRVQQKAGLAVHALAFLIVNAVLAAQTGFDPAAGYVWGWGIGLGAHLLFVLAAGSTLRQRLIERELERLQRTP